MGAYICAHPSLREKEFGDRFVFTCDGCEETGYGSCYTCTNNCDFHLHKACHNAPPTIKSHPFFIQGPFVLDKSIILAPQAAHNCAACGTSVQGWRYVLTTNNIFSHNTIYLHPCCMQLPHTALLPVLKSIDCLHCQSMVRVGNNNNDEGEVKGWAYVTRGTVVHVKCMKDMLHMDWERRYDNNSSSSSNNNHGHDNNEDYNYGTRDRRLGCQGNQGCGRMRKRDYFFRGLKGLAQALSILNDLAIIDLDSIKEDMMEFVENFQGN
ncbi:uncharacterized protein LOC110710659 isoform X2 [Chenopodium quinoa]|nr:uncharacterized protein LOC110710648 isoform X2 [Chenopodium quinoa]XP_021744691.1 uncharacterized protein LOC110710659 isoform X2 [Chenopodium quinoa]